MKLYAPRYYKDFKCIADRCRHSCCVGWEIDIDSDTLKKYETLTNEYGKEIIKTVDCTDAPHFRLSSGDRCPHLDEQGLCRIITNIGEDYLCDICREYPRFYNDTAKGKAVGLGLSCEEAARIILSSDGYTDLVLLGEINGEEVKPEFDVLPYIERIYSILSDSNLDYKEKLSGVYAVGAYSEPLINDVDAKALFMSLEYLDERNRALFAAYKSPLELSAELEKILERALAYFVFRHLPKASDEQELYAYLGFCLLCERLIAFLVSSGDVNDLSGFIDLARVVSEELEYSEENTYAVASEFYAKNI